MRNEPPGREAICWKFWGCGLWGVVKEEQTGEGAGRVHVFQKLLLASLALKETVRTLYMWSVTLPYRARLPPQLVITQAEPAASAPACRLHTRMSPGRPRTVCSSAAGPLLASQLQSTPLLFSWKSMWQKRPVTWYLKKSILILLSVNHNKRPWFHCPVLWYIFPHVILF